MEKEHLRNIGKGKLRICLIAFILMLFCSACSASERPKIGMSLRVHTDGTGILETSIVLPESTYNALSEYSTIGLDKYKLRRYEDNGKYYFASQDIVYFDDMEDMRTEMQKLSSRLRVVHISADYGWNEKGPRTIGIRFEVKSNEEIKRILSGETFWHKSKVEALSGNLLNAEFYLQLDGNRMDLPCEDSEHAFDKESSIAKLKLISRPDKSRVAVVVGTSGNIGDEHIRGNKFEPIRTFVDGQFTDVSKDYWYYEFIEEAYKYGFIDGAANGNFNPNGVLTIAQAIKITASIAAVYYGDVSLIDSYKLPDRPWYYPYSMYLIYHGIMKTSGQFGDDYTRAIKRGEFCQLFSNIFHKTEYIADSRIIWSEFKDIDSSSDYYAPIERLRLAGVISGFSDGTFRADNTLTRAQACKFMCNLVDMENINLSDIAYWVYDRLAV